MVTLNTISPAPGSRHSRKIVGRGAGSGLGKTCGKGHKGQKARSGGSIRPGFEGGQMPLQMRLPKFGFSSNISRLTANVRISELSKCKTKIINLQNLMDSGVVNKNIKYIKIYLSGEIFDSYTIEKGIRISKGAKLEIEKNGGKVLDSDNF